MPEAVGFARPRAGCGGAGSPRGAPRPPASRPRGPPPPPSSRAPVAPPSRRSPAGPTWASARARARAPAWAAPPPQPARAARGRSTRACEFGGWGATGCDTQRQTGGQTGGGGARPEGSDSRSRRTCEPGRRWCGPRPQTARRTLGPACGGQQQRARSAIVRSRSEFWAKHQSLRNGTAGWPAARLPFPQDLEIAEEGDAVVLQEQVSCAATERYGVTVAAWPTQSQDIGGRNAGCGRPAPIVLRVRRSYTTCLVLRGTACLHVAGQRGRLVVIPRRHIAPGTASGLCSVTAPAAPYGPQLLLEEEIEGLEEAVLHREVACVHLDEAGGPSCVL